MRAWSFLALLGAGCGRFGFEPSGGAAEAGAPFVDDATTGAQHGNLVFVTSAAYVPGMLGSLANADNLCAMHAASAGLSGTFVAWLSSSTVAASSRLGSARGWVRRDGLPFADTLADLLAGHIYYPVLLDENGTAYPNNQTMATGTLADGTLSATYTCTDYTNPTVARRLIAGIADAATTSWTYDQFVSCDQPRRLYCFQTDFDTPLTPPAGTSRKAFESSAVWMSNGGLAAADALCASDAAAAGVPGTFVALLATSSTAAANRLPPGKAWSRVDGAFVTADFTTQLAAVDLSAAGVYQDDVYAWLGAATANDPGTAASTCLNWTSMGSGDYGFVGHTGRSDGIFGANQICNTSASRVLCFQQ